MQCWTGNDDEAFVARHEAGAIGAVSVASNLIPGMAMLPTSFDFLHAQSLGHMSCRPCTLDFATVALKSGIDSGTACLLHQ